MIEMAKESGSGIEREGGRSESGRASGRAKGKGIRRRVRGAKAKEDRSEKRGLIGGIGKEGGKSRYDDMEPGFELQGSKMVEIGSFGSKMLRTPSFFTLRLQFFQASLE
ncbi:hypothetical protein Tco_1088295 [Tanacetum coccineum]